MLFVLMMFYVLLSFLAYFICFYRLSIVFLLVLPYCSNSSLFILLIVSSFVLMALLCSIVHVIGSLVSLVIFFSNLSHLSQWSRIGSQHFIVCWGVLRIACLLISDPTLSYSLPLNRCLLFTFVIARSYQLHLSHLLTIFSSVYYDPIDSPFSCSLLHV